MKKDKARKVPKPIDVDGDGARMVTVKRARAIMEDLTTEASDLREDESQAAKSRRVQIKHQLRAIQKQIEALEPDVEVEIPLTASPHFPFRVGRREFWPGRHVVKAGVAATLRHMMDQHRKVEGKRLVPGGNTSGFEELEGGTYPPRYPKPHDERGRELPPL